MNGPGSVKIFISDLHLGDGSKADDFNRKDDFFRFLDLIEGIDAELFVVGDLFELWQADLDRIVFFHTEVIKRLLSLADKKRLTYIIGNHDHIPFVKYIESGLPVYLEFEDNNTGVWAEHGNQYDIFNRYEDPRLAVKNNWGRAASRTIGLLERIVHPDIDEWARRQLLEKRGLFIERAAVIKNKLIPSSGEYYRRGGGLTEYEEAAGRRIRQGHRIVIFGHTHRPVLKRLDSGIYANCGCWCGKVEPTYVKVSGESVELIDGIKHKVINSLELL